MDKDKSDILETCLEKLPKFALGTSTTLKSLFEKYLSGDKLDKEYFPNDQEKVHFSKNFMRKMRVFLQNSMEASITSNSTVYSSEAAEVLHFVFWCAEIDLIDTAGAYIIMEDIYDCLSLREIVVFFEFMEQEFTRKEKAFTMSQQQSLLRIGNSILKKFSKVHDTELRGRVQMFLTFISQLSDKTGVNPKSTINPNNPTDYDKNPPKAEDANTLKRKDSFSLPSSNSFAFYQKFWELQKYLHNPGLLFVQPDEVDSVFLSSADAENTATEEELDEAGQKKADKATTARTKFPTFCSIVLQVLEIFEKDVYEVGNEVHSVKRYPKYFTENSLLDIQLKDPYFRKTWLTQVELSIFALKNPIKFIKSQYELKSEDTKLLDEIENKIEKITQKMYLSAHPRDSVTAKARSLHHQLKPFLEKEKHFINWKENNCQSYEKPPSKELIDYFSLYNSNAGYAKFEKTMNWRNKMTPCGPPTRYMEKSVKFVQDNAATYLKYTQYDVPMDFKILETEKMQLPEDPVEPSVAYYFDNIISDMKTPNLDEEDKVVNDPTYVWRSLRVLSKNCIDLFSVYSKTDLGSEWKIEEIAKRMLNKVGGGSSNGVGGSIGERTETEQASQKEENAQDAIGDKEKPRTPKAGRTPQGNEEKSSAPTKTTEKEKEKPKDRDRSETREQQNGNHETKESTNGNRAHQNNNRNRQDAGSSRNSGNDRGNQDKGQDKGQDKIQERNHDKGGQDRGGQDRGGQDRGQDKGHHNRNDRGQNRDKSQDRETERLPDQERGGKRRSPEQDLSKLEHRTTVNKRVKEA